MPKRKTPPELLAEFDQEEFARRVERDPCIKAFRAKIKEIERNEALGRQRRAEAERDLGPLLDERKKAAAYLRELDRIISRRDGERVVKFKHRPGAVGRIKVQIQSREFAIRRHMLAAAELSEHFRRNWMDKLKQERLINEHYKGQSNGPLPGVVQDSGRQAPIDHNSDSQPPGSSADSKRVGLAGTGDSSADRPPDQ